jgi:hypothetical protein
MQGHGSEGQPKAVEVGGGSHPLVGESSCVHVAPDTVASQMRNGRRAVDAKRLGQRLGRRASPVGIDELPDLLSGQPTLRLQRPPFSRG